MSFIQGYARKLGVLEYRGTWNASTNTPSLQSGQGTRGEYYVVSTAGSTNLDGISDWGVKDWLVFNGTAWEKIDNSEAGYTREEADTKYTEAKARENHTGTQLAETISNFTESAQLAIGDMLGSSPDIDLVYPDENGKISASLTSTGVSAGFYNNFEVDSKGRIISATNVVVAGSSTYSYNTTGSNSTTLTSFINIPGLTTDSLGAGLYRFRFIALAQSSATTTGIGVRFVPTSASVSTIYAKYWISQSVPGTTQAFEYDQVSQNTNVTSASAASTTNGFVIMGEGMVRITSPGTASMQFKSEVADSAVSISADANLFLELV